MYEIEILSIRLDGNRQGSLAHDRITSDEGSKWGVPNDIYK